MDKHQGAKTALDEMKVAFIRCAVDVGLPLTREYFDLLWGLSQNPDSAMTEIINELRKDKDEFLRSALDTTK